MSVRSTAVHLVLVTGIASSAAAEVTETHSAGFTSAHTAQVSATPKQALREFARISHWWDAAHSFSGKSKALKLDLRLGGCFCERAGGLQVKHLEVLRIEPDRRIVLQGALGPLQTMAVQAVLEVETIANEQGTELRWSYRVAGGNPQITASLAKPVDGVMAGQFKRWVAALE